jgi:hypothetical protein
MLSLNFAVYEDGRALDLAYLRSWARKDGSRWRKSRAKHFEKFGGALMVGSSGRGGAPTYDERRHSQAALKLGADELKSERGGDRRTAAEARVTEASEAHEHHDPRSRLQHHGTVNRHTIDGDLIIARPVSMRGAPGRRKRD